MDNAKFKGIEDIYIYIYFIYLWCYLVTLVLIVTLESWTKASPSSESESWFRFTGVVFGFLASYVKFSLINHYVFQSWS